MVFFYQAAVLHGGADSSSLSQAWQQFAEAHQIPLVLCTTVAENEYGITDDNRNQAYSSGGLSEFSMAAAHADHVIQF